MNAHPAHPHDVVRVHPGIHAGGHHLGGMCLTVTGVHDGLVDTAEWTGAPVITLPASAVDVITPPRSHPMTHLWEIKHPYYAADGYDEDCASFAELKSGINALDEDMNLVYRWDWEDDSQPHRDDLFCDGDDRSGERLRVHTLMPRKSRFATFTCPIQKHQEFEVLEWLSGPRCLGHLQKLWAPVMDSLPAGEPSDREASIWGHHVTALEEIQRSIAAQLAAARERTGEQS